MKKKPGIQVRRVFIILIISIILSLCMNQAIRVFADAFLPDDCVTLRIVPCSDSKVRELTIVCENKRYEIFNQFKDIIEENGDDGIYHGWKYTAGEYGKTWTRIQASETGSEITVSVRANPDYYFAVLSNRWSGAFEMSVSGGEWTLIDCYDESKSSSDIYRIKPFENDIRKQGFVIVFHIIAAVLFCCMLHIFGIGKTIIKEQKRNVR